MAGAVSLYPAHGNSPPDVTPYGTPPEPHVDFWTCDDDVERLTHDNLDEAVLEFVDKWDCFDGSELESIIRTDIAPLTVYGYARAVVTDKRLESWAEDMVERLVDVLNDDAEWAHPDADAIIDQEGQRMLRVLVTDALKQVRGRIVPWHCEVVTKRVLQADELVALVKDMEPGWFEVDK